MSAEPPTKDFLPGLPDNFRDALEEGRDLPELPPLSFEMNDRQFSRYCELRRRIDQQRSLVKQAIKVVERRIAADESYERWLRPQAIAHANTKPTGKSRSFGNIEAGISGKLRRSPAKLVVDPAQESAFLLFDAEHDHHFTRWKMSAGGLTYADMELLKTLLPEHLRERVFCRWEPDMAEVNEEWKDKKTVPPGFREVPAHDDLYVDGPAKLEAKSDPAHDEMYLAATTDPMPKEEAKEEAETWMP